MPVAGNESVLGTSGDDSDGQ